MIRDLLACVTPEAMPVAAQPEAGEAAEGAFAGLTVVLTGTLSGMTRDEAERLIAQAGGKCTGSVSKKTGLVVYGEKAGSKLEKARALGLRTMDEAEFRSTLGL